MASSAGRLRTAGLIVILAGLVGGAAYASRIGGVVEKLADMLLGAGVAVAAIALLARDRIARAEQSEKKLAALLDSVDDAAFILDRDGRYDEVWGPRDRLLAAGEVLRGKNVADYVPPDVAKLVISSVRDALAEGKRRTVDYALEIEGRVTWWNAMVTPIDPKHVMWVARDITARKNMEKALEKSNIELNGELAETIDALRRSEERYRGIVEQAREVIFTLGADGNFTSLNPAFESILGWRSEEWLGRPFGELFGRLLGDGAAEALASFEDTLRDHSEGEWELPVVDAFGEARILNCVARVVRNANSRAVRIIGTAQDVTQRRGDEQRLRESDERFRLMGRATNDVVWDWHLPTDVCWWGDGLQSLFGYDPADAIPIAFWWDRVHPDDLPRVRESIETAKASDAMSWVAEYRFRCADGRYAYVLDRAHIARDASNVAVRMVGAMMDVSERRTMQQQLAEAKRLSSLGRIATSIAHEFNNVLMGMQANLEVVRRRAPAQLARPVDHILSSVLRGKRVTDEILGFTRSAAPSLQDVSVALFLARWEEETRPLLGTLVTLTTEVEPGMTMRADARQLAQALTNLALNARDAMPGGGTFRVIADRGASGNARSAHVHGFVHFSVQDDGAGMPGEVLQHIFEPLFTTKQGGTGLGLAVAHQIVSRHGGFITAESQPGRGTRFDLLIPAAQTVAQAAEQVVAVAGSCRSVVIVDDDETVISGLQSLLEYDRVRVAIATRGGEAVPLIEREMPDVVILDIGLPDISGADVYEMIAERWPTLPVLFSSGHADAARLEPWLRKPNVALLLKPYDYVALQRELALFLATAGGGTRSQSKPAMLRLM